MKRALCRQTPKMVGKKSLQSLERVMLFRNTIKQSAPPSVRRDEQIHTACDPLWRISVVPRRVCDLDKMVIMSRSICIGLFSAANSVFDMYKRF